MNDEYMPKKYSSQTMYSSSYGGKRPLWQWLAMYLIIGAVIYALVYYFVYARRSGYSYLLTSSPSPTSAPQGLMVTSNGIVMVKQVRSVRYLTDIRGMTLYTFAKDSKNVSTCVGACATLWLPYVKLNGNLPLVNGLTLIHRTDGRWQYAWHGWPLYFYAKDKVTGDMLGNGFNGLWSIVTQ